MTSVVDVGDAFTLTYTTTAGATVTVDWLDPDLAAVYDQQDVTAASGHPTQFPVTFTATRAGMWTARFFDAGGSQDYFVRATSTVNRPPPLAAVDDVGIRYGDLDDDQTELAGYLLKAASAMVRQRFPLIGEQMTAGWLDPDVVAQTVAGMVLRVLWNPEGLRAESTGPFSRTYDTTAAAGQLVITIDDAQSFVPAQTAVGKKRFPNVGTIRAVPGLAPPVDGGRYGPW